VRLVLERNDPDGPAPVPLGVEGEALAAFFSFAVSRGFGATHPLIALADRLHDTHRISLGRVTTFYDADEEDSEDREKRDMSWQDAGPLREEVAAISSVLASDSQAAALVRRAGDPPLAAELEALATALGSLPADARVRLGYWL